MAYRITTDCGYTVGMGAMMDSMIFVPTVIWYHTFGPFVSLKQTVCILQSLESNTHTYHNQAPYTTALAHAPSHLTERATHAHPLHPAALAPVPYGIVLVRVRWTVAETKGQDRRHYSRWDKKSPPFSGGMRKTTPLFRWDGKFHPPFQVG